MVEAEGLFSWFQPQMKSLTETSGQNRQPGENTHQHTCTSPAALFGRCSLLWSHIPNFTIFCIYLVDTALIFCIILFIVAFYLGDILIQFTQSQNEYFDYKLYFMSCSSMFIDNTTSLSVLLILILVVWMYI